VLYLKIFAAAINPSSKGLTGGGFRVKSKKNVIFRNLKLSFGPAPTDLIAIQLATNSTSSVL
jgi:pectate lyase